MLTEPAEAGSWRTTTTVAFLEPSDCGKLASGFLVCVQNFCWNQSCQKKKIYPTKRPSRRPAPPSLASLSSTSEAFRSCATLPTIGTPSGLSVLTRQTSWLPPILKQVSNAHSFGCILSFLMKLYSFYMLIHTRGLQSSAPREAFWAIFYQPKPIFTL